METNSNVVKMTGHLVTTGGLNEETGEPGSKSRETVDGSVNMAKVVVLLAPFHFSQ